MPRWIDLKERQPKRGQLVVIKSAPYKTFGFDQAVNSDITLCQWGTYTPEEPLYHLEKNATHWYPLPIVNEPPDPERERLRSYFPRIFQQCEDIKREMHKRAPLINWSVMPAADLDLDATRFNYAWKIKGSVEVDGLTLNCEYMVTDEILQRAGDYLDYVVRYVANGIAQEMLK